MSVVVACVERTDSLRACLDSLLASCATFDVEIIVVVAGDLANAGTLEVSYPTAKIITCSSTALVPQLWGEGIVASRGVAVALTLCQCIASREWGRAIMGALNDGAAAAGGPITISPAASTVDAAVFFLRYSAFMSGSRSEASRIVEIAGDNSAYSRNALEIGGWNRESGFWEVDVNDLLRRRGDVIAWVPSATMEFANAGGLRNLSHHRFEHGRLFGHSRATSRGESPIRIAFAAPLVPLVLIARAARRTWPRKEYRAKLAGSLPAFMWLAACWAFGEAVGAMEAGLANRR